ncbi:MAG: hypothetical protein QOE50_80 [Sphingomonadales bacterium]|jgi:hypothetical protein|nr:hypothetical protein [Sphingomonadales bacterium]
MLGVARMDLRLSTADHAPVVARTTLWIVLGLVLANLLFNAAASALHLGYPYTSFLSQPDDRFGDFFKLTFSYPGAPIHPAAGSWGVDQLLAHHMADIKKYEGTVTNHFHEPPIPTLFALGARRLISLIEPVLLFLGLLVTALAWLFWTVLRAAPSGRPGAALALSALLGYPALLAIDRGHFFALACATLTIAATFRTLRGKADGWAILMFAIAVNIRPNAGIVPLALFLGKQGLSFRNAVLLGVMAVSLFAATMAVDHAMYPEYTLHRFIQGIAEYAIAYGGDIGFENGSSLYGMLRGPIGYSPKLVFVPLCVGALLFVPAVLESRQNQLRSSEFLFLILCAYVLGSHVFADYHLLAFIIPLILVAREEGPMDVSAWTILLASSLMLAPKNFIFHPHGGAPWSWQVVVNPLVLLAAASVVLWSLWRRNAERRRRAALDTIAAV